MEVYKGAKHIITLLNRRKPLNVFNAFLEFMRERVKN